MNTKQSSATNRDFFVRLTNEHGSVEDDGRDEGGEGIHLTEAEAVKRATTPGQYARGWVAEVMHWA